MIDVSLSWVAEAVSGELQGKDIAIASISTDTRSIAQGDLFIALSGENFDAHQFVQQAQEMGAAALLVAKKVDSELPMVVVKDTRIALGQLAAAVKNKVSPATVGITGSSGKTTVKEMVAAILSEKGKVLATAGNFNNDIGVPLTLLRLSKDDQFAVVEMGANHRGEIAYTTALAKPNVATIINAAEAHLEGFGSLDGVAKAKNEIFSGLAESGVAVLNADSPFYDFWRQGLQDKTLVSFALEQSADFSASDIHYAENGCATFCMHTPQGQIDIRLNTPGRHNIANALVAAALAMNVGASLSEVQLGLAKMTSVKGRTALMEISSTLSVLDDTYNANVLSVRAAVELLAAYQGHRILVLGDMGELGADAQRYHQQVGKHAAELGVDALFSAGELSQLASDEMTEKGHHFAQIEQLVQALVDYLQQQTGHTTVLVKGSRSAKMERVVAALADRFQPYNNNNEEAGTC